MVVSHTAFCHVVIIKRHFKTVKRFHYHTQSAKQFFDSNRRRTRARLMTSVGTQTNAKPDHGQKGNEMSAIPNVFNVPRQFGFPSNIITRLRYADHKILTSSTLTSTVYRMNSLFDPDLTAAGHQPLYFDAYAGIYNHYTVIGSKLTATFTRQSGAISVLVGLAVDDDSTFSTTFQTLMEQNKATSSLLGLADGGDASTTLSVTYGPEENEGLDPYAGTDLIRTAVGSNPTEVFCANIWAISSDATTSAVTTVNVNIEFTVLFSELVTPTQS